VRLVLPLVLKRTLAGFLSVVGPAAAFDELDELTLGPAGIVCALELAKQRAVAETEYRLQADVLEAALSGRFASEGEVIARARALGYELDGDQVSLVFAPDDARRAPAFDQDGLHPRPRVLDALRRVLETQQRTALLRQHGDRVAAFFARADAAGSSVPDQAESVRRAVVAHLDGPSVSVGVGRPYPGVAGLALGFREAEEALLIGQELSGGNCTVYFGDLGIRRLLFPLRDSPELSSFYQEFLGALETYDTRHGTELIRTLEGFFAHHGNHVRAAEALHLHRNTLLYRLARIQSIAGLDLDDAEVRLAVQVCLRMRPLAGSRWQPAREETSASIAVASEAPDHDGELAMSAPRTTAAR
jgi:purine catabolism regulator